MNVRSVLVLAVGGVAAFFLHREQERGTFASLDRGHVEWLLANRKVPVLDSAPQVVMVRLDDVDHAESERQFEAWPPTPVEWSGLLEELRGYDPKVCVIPTSSAWAVETPDPALQKTCAAWPGWLLGVRAEGQGELMEESAPILEHVIGLVEAVPNFQSIPGSAVYKEYRSQMGEENRGITQIDLSEAADAKPTFHAGIWRMPLLFRQGTRVIPSLPLFAVLRHLGIPLDQVRVVLGESLTLGASGQVPIDASGVFEFHDHAINRADLPTLNLDTFKMSREQIERFLGSGHATSHVLHQLKGSLCWIGEDDLAARRFVRVDGSKVSLAEMQARAITALLSGRNVRLLAPWQQGLTLAAVLLFGLWLIRCPRSRLLFATFLGVLLLGLASMLVMQSSGQWMPVGPALIVLGIMALFCLCIRPAEKEV